MTIAAGIVCGDSVLLCADTEITGWTGKSLQPKLGQFDCPGGTIGFALAGGSNFAWSAIEKVREGLQSVPPEDTMGELESTLEVEYRRHVFGHPSFPNDSSLAYWLLIAYRAALQPVELYVTSETALRRVRDCACIGIGGETGEHLIRLSANTGMSYREAFYLASYALARVKRSIQGCGGGTTFLILRKDGATGTSSSYQEGPAKQVESISLAFDRITQDLLLKMANSEISDEAFGGYLERNFVPTFRRIRQEWSTEWNDRIEKTANANPHLTADQVRQLCLEWSIGFASPPLPSQE